MRIGNRSCPMIGDADQQAMPSYWSTDYTNCTTPDVVAGLYNVSVNVADIDDGLGDAYTTFQNYHGKGSLYQQ